MRRGLCALMMTLVLTLSACGARTENEAEKRLQEMRGRYLEMTVCSGHIELTADYGQRVYSYGMDLTWERNGRTTLVLTGPESMAGTAAVIEAGETALEYQGVMLETGPLDESGLSPVDAPTALLNYAGGGFVAECSIEEDNGVRLLRILCRDPEKAPGTGVEAELWFSVDGYSLVRGEIASEGRTVIQSRWTGFTMTVPTEEG